LDNYQEIKITDAENEQKLITEVLLSQDDERQPQDIENENDKTV
jgi:hypothetical protein